MNSAYLTHAARIAADLRAAIRAASSLLPEGIRVRQWMFAQHSPSQSSAWERAHDWFYGQEEADEETLRVLLHLKLLTAALADVTTVTAPQPVGAPDLRLPRTRTNTIVRRAE